MRIAALCLAIGCWTDGQQPPARPVSPPPTETPAPASWRVDRPAPSRMERAMMRMEEFTEEMCACTDSQCASEVSGRMTKWATELQGELQDDARPDEAQIKRMTEISERMAKCLTGAMSGP